jgi:hypothetical protein
MHVSVEGLIDLSRGEERRGKRERERIPAAGINLDKRVSKKVSE